MMSMKTMTDAPLKEKEQYDVYEDNDRCFLVQ